MEKTAYELARKKLFFCSDDDNIQELAKHMAKKNLGSLLVKDDKGTISGIVTVGDVLRVVARRDIISKIRAKDIKSSPVVFANMHMSNLEAAEEFKKHNVTRLILTDKKNKPVGVLRDLAVYKCLSVSKFYEEASERFAREYPRPLY